MRSAVRVIASASVFERLFFFFLLRAALTRLIVGALARSASELGLFTVEWLAAEVHSVHLEIAHRVDQLHVHVFAVGALDLVVDLVGRRYQARLDVLALGGLVQRVTSLVLATLALAATPLLATIDADIAAANRDLVRSARAQHHLNCVHQLIVLREQCIPYPIRQGTVPLKHISVNLLVALVQSRRAAGWPYRHAHVHGLIEALLQLVQDVVVWRLLIERQHEHLFQAIVEVARHHTE